MRLSELHCHSCVFCSCVNSFFFLGGGLATHFWRVKLLCRRYLSMNLYKSGVGKFSPEKNSRNMHIFHNWNDQCPSICFKQLSQFRMYLRWPWNQQLLCMIKGAFDFCGNISGCVWCNSTRWPQKLTTAELSINRIKRLPIRFNRPI